MKLDLMGYWGTLTMNNIEYETVELLENDF